MEFYEKLQELRKGKGLTQEELAQALYVSRTAISKWESGRGYPNIDSLKSIAKFFSVTVDALLSSSEVLTVAEQDQKQKGRHLRDLVFGALDLCFVLLLFLPLFGQATRDGIYGVSLLSLTATAPWLKFLYFDVVTSTAVWGVLTLALQGWQNPRWERLKGIVSLVLGAVAVLLFTVCRQPYAAAFALVLLAVKVFILIRSK